MPASRWMSWQAACALMRALARGPSGTLMQSMPWLAQSRAPAISRAASTPRGGRISTNATNLPAASFAPSLRFLRHGRRRQRLRLGFRLLYRDLQLLLPGLQRSRFRADQLDVLGRGAAAAAHDLHPRPQQTARVLRHVFRRARDRYCGPPPAAAGPALGMALMGFEENAIMRSMVSSVALGPTEQLMPMASTGQESMARVKVSVSAPPRQVAEIVDGDLRDHRQIAAGRFARAQTPPRAVRPGCRKSPGSAGRRRLPPGLRSARGTPRGLRRTTCGRAARCGRPAVPPRRPRKARRARLPAPGARPARLMSRSFSANPKAARRGAVAPNVLVSRISAPALTYSW